MLLRSLPAAHQRRFAAALLSVGAATVAIESFVLRLFGPAPQRMGPNTTLALVVVAVAMLLCFAGLRRVAAVLGALVAAFAAVTLLKGPLGLDVDDALATWLSGKSHKMAPNTALTLMLLGFAQAVAGPSEVRRTAQAAAATASFGIAALALVAMVLRLPMAEVWQGASMKVPTALSVLALSGARFLVVLGPSAGVRWWIPGAVGLGGLAISAWSMVAAHAILHDQQRREEQLVESDVAARVERALRLRVDALVRYAARTSDPSDTDEHRRTWQRDTALVLRDFPGLEAIALLDEHGRCVWQSDGAPAATSWVQTFAGLRSAAPLQPTIARDPRRPGALGVVVPFAGSDGARGAWVALLDVAAMLAPFINAGIASRYHVRVYDDDRRVLGAAWAADEPERRVVAAVLDDSTLSVSASPHTSQSAGGGRLIFFFGASFSILGAAATTFAERNRVRSREGSQAEQTAHALAQRFGALFDDSPVATLEVDMSAARALIVEFGSGDLSRGRDRIAQNPTLALQVRAAFDTLAVNAATFRLFEAADHAGLDRSARFSAEHNDPLHVQRQVLDLIDTGHSTREVTLAIGPDIEKRVSSSVRILPGNEATWARAVVTLLDLSQRAQMERALRASLQEKEVLLREVHHRVKNNLQVISSLLSMQARSIKDPAARLPFDDSMARIRAMSLVHEELYQGRELSRVDFDRTVKRLLEYLEAIHDDRERVVITCTIEPVSLPIDLAIPCGLALAELIGNCFKHAFADGRRGAIHVSLLQRGRTIEVEVRDDGMGLPAGFELMNTHSLGMDLLAAFTEQLRARLSIESTRGTTFRLAFEEDAP